MSPLRQPPLHFISSPIHKQQQQQIVILAGPHKTASSTTQDTLVSLQKQKLLNEYVWPTEYNPLIGRTNYHNKQFNTFAERLLTSDLLHPSVKHYAKEFETIWNKGRSIVVGAELFGSSSISPSGHNLFHGLDQVLPSSAKKTVVLNFRSQRLSHLQSIWGQYNWVNHPHNKGISFTQFICSMDCSLQQPNLNLNVLNTLGQAEAYRRANYNVVIIDMGGVHRDGLDVANIPACEVLGVDCVDGVPKGMRRVTKSNVARGRGNEYGVLVLVEEEMEEILKRMDCSYEFLMGDKNVKVLHRLDMFSGCDKWVMDSAIDAKQACVLIQNVMGCNSNWMSNLIGVEGYGVYGLVLVACLFVFVIIVGLYKVSGRRKAHST